MDAPVPIAVPSHHRPLARRVQVRLGNPVRARVEAPPAA